MATEYIHLKTSLISRTSRYDRKTASNIFETTLRSWKRGRIRGKFENNSTRQKTNKSNRRHVLAINQKSAECWQTDVICITYLSLDAWFVCWFDMDVIRTSHIMYTELRDLCTDEKILYV